MPVIVRPSGRERRRKIRLEAIVPVAGGEPGTGPGATAGSGDFANARALEAGRRLARTRDAMEALTGT